MDKLTPVRRMMLAVAFSLYRGKGSRLRDPVLGWMTRVIHGEKRAYPDAVSEIMSGDLTPNQAAVLIADAAYQATLEADVPGKTAAWKKRRADDILDDRGPYAVERLLAQFNCTVPKSVEQAVRRRMSEY